MVAVKLLPAGRRGSRDDRVGVAEVLRRARWPEGRGESRMVSSTAAFALSTILGRRTSVLVGGGGFRRVCGDGGEVEIGSSTSSGSLNSVSGVS